SILAGSRWRLLEMPGLPPYPLTHYVDVQISIPGNPPTPQALAAALAAAAKILGDPGEHLRQWADES
ncbi:MAG TPA: hypothetical protein VM409_07620, partial [Chloroflexia bacterium]|nr:hypothetical protein [Chloroflexia bacterium]